MSRPGLPEQGSTDEVAETTKINFLTVLEVQDQDVSILLPSGGCEGRVCRGPLPLAYGGPSSPSASLRGCPSVCVSVLIFS